jgi:hypothetical protein
MSCAHTHTHISIGSRKRAAPARKVVWTPSSPSSRHPGTSARPARTTTARTRKPSPTPRLREALEGAARGSNRVPGNEHPAGEEGAARGSKPGTRKRAPGRQVRRWKGRQEEVTGYPETSARRLAAGPDILGRLRVLFSGLLLFFQGFGKQRWVEPLSDDQVARLSACIMLPNKARTADLKQ